MGIQLINKLVHSREIQCWLRTDSETKHLLINAIVAAVKFAEEGESYRSQIWASVILMLLEDIHQEQIQKIQLAVNRIQVLKKLIISSKNHGSCKDFFECLEEAATFEPMATKNLVNLLNDLFR